MQAARLCFVVVVLTITSSCDKMIATKEAQRSMSETTIYSVYQDLGVPIDETLATKAADKVDRIPASLSLDDRYRCYYETMVVVDFARRRAGKQSFPETGRVTDDDLSEKAIKGAILLSDQPLPATAVTEEFLSSHVAEYAVPSDGDALFVHAIWRASYFRSITNQFGVEGLTGPKGDKWLTKGRSLEPADMSYRKRANLGIGERRCYDSLGSSFLARQSENIDAESLAKMLTSSAK